MMARPCFLFDNRLADDDPIATGSEASPDNTGAGDPLNLRDWRASTIWQPATLPAFLDIDTAGHAWEFNGSTDGWTADNANLTFADTYAILEATGADMRFRSPVAFQGDAESLKIDGSVQRYVVARIQRKGGSGWDGALTYLNNRHTEGTTGTKPYVLQIADPTQLNEWRLAVWDMWSAADYVAEDWKAGGFIHQLRLDFGGAGGDDNFWVDWIITTPNLTADYGLVWGHDLASKSCELVFEGSNDLSGNNYARIAKVRPERDVPFAEFFGAAQRFRYWRIAVWPINRLEESQRLDQTIWKIFNITRAGNAAAAPDGTTTATRISETAVTDVFRIRQSRSSQAGVTYEFSVYAKADGRDYVELDLSNNGFPANANAIFNLATGSVLSQGSGVLSANTRNVGSGWRRCTIYATADVSVYSALFTSIFIHDGVARSHVGSAGDGLLIWGTQFREQEPGGGSNSTRAQSYQATPLPEMPILSIAAIGNRLDAPAGLRQGFDPVAREPVGPFNRSVEGNPLGRVVLYETWQANLDLRFVSWSWLRDSWRPAWDAHIRGTPFVFAWDRENYPAELFLANHRRGYRGPHNTGNAAPLLIPMEGLALS